MTDKEKHAGGQIGALIIGRWLALLATFLVPVILTRVLTKENYGLYCQFNTIFLCFVAVFSFAIGRNLFYFIPHVRKEDVSKILINTLYALLFTGGFCCILLQIPVVKNLFIPDSLRRYSVLVALNVFMLIPTTMVESSFISLRHKKISVWYPGTIQLLRCVILISFAVISSAIWSVLLGVTVAHTVIFVISICYIGYCVWTSSQSRGFDKSFLKQQIRYLLPIGFSNTLNCLSSYFDKLLCIHYIPSSEYALYAIAFLGVPGIIQIVQSLSDVYLLNISKALGEKKNDIALNLLKKVETKTFSFTFPVVLTVALWAEEIITLLFSVKYVGAVSYFRIYVFTMTFYSIAAGHIATGSGNSKFHFYSNITVACFMLPTIFFLVKNYGALGGIIGATAMQFLQRLVLACIEMRYLHVTIWTFLPWKPCFVISVLSIILLLPWMVFRYLYHPGWIVGGFCSMIYLLTTSSLEIYYDVFVVDKKDMMDKIVQIVRKLKCLCKQRIQ